MNRRFIPVVVAVSALIGASCGGSDGSSPDSGTVTATTVLAFAFAILLTASPAVAGDKWQPDTSCADKVKMGKSGQMYSWRKGKC